MKKVVFAVFGISILVGSAYAQMGYGSTQAKNWYQKLGIHKIAQAIDLIVDKHGNDPAFANNAKIRSAYAGLPRPALKFAVTAGVARGLGGPENPGIMDPFSVAKWFDMTREEQKAFSDDIAWGFSMIGESTYDSRDIARQIMLSIQRAKKIDNLPVGEPFKDPNSLYARLGGFVPISMVVNTFAQKLTMNPIILGNKNVVNSFVKGNVTEAGIRFLFTQQICAAAGGPYKYTGREMLEVHKNLGITEAQWEAGGKMLKEVFDMYKIPDKEQSELFNFVLATKKDIVRN